MNTLTKPLISLALLVSLAGCAGPGYYNHRGTMAGAAVGAAGGALLGYAADGGYGNGALVGGALGAVAGGAAGYAYDQNQRERRYDDGYGRSGYAPPRRHRDRY
ncbi:hypothetical protein [Methylomagnum sp.]